MIIVRVQHFYDIPCQVLLFHRSLIIALVKRIQLEALYRLCIPDPERIHNAVAVAYHRQIIRNRPYRLIALLTEIASSVLVHIDIDITAKFDFFRILRSSQFKRIAVLQPVIRHFDLITVPDLLFKHAVAIADTASVSRIS